MLTIRSLFPLVAVVLTASLFAQQDVPPPPPTPATPPEDPAPAMPKVNLPPAAEKRPAPTQNREATSSGATTVPRKSRGQSTPMPIATPIPMGTPKPSFWQRIFGRRRPPAQRERSTPAPVAAKSKPTPAPRTAAKSRSTEANERTSSAPAAVKAEPEQTRQPKPPTREEKPKSTPAPKTADPSSEESKLPPEPKPPVKARSTPAPPPPNGEDPEAVERHKFNEAKRKALEDSEVQSLKVKAESTSSEEDARKALRAYNKALFQKMRKLDPSIKDRVDAMESALMKRLE